MKYSSNNKSKNKEKQSVKISYSKDFAHKYEEIDRLIEQVYSR